MNFTAMALGHEPVAPPRRRDSDPDTDIPALDEDIFIDVDESHSSGGIPFFDEEDSTPHLDTLLVDMLKGQDNKLEHNRSASFDGHIHVSSLLDFCPRRLFLSNKYEQDQYKAVDGNMRIVWAMGRAVENHIRTQLIASNPEDSFGNWSCVCGDCYIESSYKPSPEEGCSRCGSSVDVYEEHTLRHDEAGVVGNPDFIIRVNDLLVPVEIKSINAKEFDTLTAPKGDHVFQVSSYHKILREQYPDLPLSNNCIILYANKDFKWMETPYKQFVIDGRDFDNQLDLSFHQSKHAVECIEQDLLPSKLPACTSVGCKKAKGCALKTLCFSL